MKLILASASPRRREILTAMGVPFSVRVAEADETCDLPDAGARVEAIAARKCEAATRLLSFEGGLDEDTLILAADTLVTLDGAFLGKPRDEDDARRMVARLQGRSHTVAGGLCLWYRGRTVTAHELTRVKFAPMTDADIAAYLATDEWQGKAGGYAIQGYAARFIEGVEGDYFNVVGLPVHRLFSTLADELNILL